MTKTTKISDKPSGASVRTSTVVIDVPVGPKEDDVPKQPRLLLSHMVVDEIELDRIDASPNNPRRTFEDGDLDKLANSIQQHGLLQPLTVRESGGGRYELIAGERRLRAMRMLGIDRAPAAIRRADDGQVAQLALVENIQRVQLRPIEEARAIEALRAAGMDAARVAEKLGRGQQYVERALGLLSLPDVVLEEVDCGRLTAAQAAALVRFARWPEVACHMASEAIERGTPATEIAEQAVPFANSLVRSKVVVDLTLKPYREAVCALCPFGAYLTNEREGYRREDWCLQPAHADQLDEEFRQEHARRQESVREKARAAHVGGDPAAAPPIRDLGYGTFEALHGIVPTGCTGECPCRGVVCESGGGRTVAVCLDPKRLRGLTSAQTRRRNKEAGAIASDLKLRVLAVLQGAEPMDRRLLAVLAKDVLSRIRYGSKGVLQQAANLYLGGRDLERLGGRWSDSIDDYRRIADLDLSSLVRTIVAAMAFGELSDPKNTHRPIVNWLLAGPGDPAPDAEPAMPVGLDDPSDPEDPDGGPEESDESWYGEGDEEDV